jgi:hypothetical protein
MLPSKMKCSNCQLWADMGDGKGECGQMHQSEQLTEFFVRHFVPATNPHYPKTFSSDLGCWKAGPPPDTKYKLRGALITDQDFYCAGFEECVLEI